MWRRFGLVRIGDRKPKAPNKRELAVDVWKALGGGSIGAEELKRIQRAIVDEFGEGADESPASLARTLADKGARLRHPEVILADVRWRQARFCELFSPNELNFDSLDDAENSIRKFEELRRQFEAEEDSVGLDRLRELARGIKDDQLKLIGRSKSNAVKNRRTRQEIIQWLTIWLQSPQIFEDWLSLRRSSAQFIQFFGP